MFNPYRRRTFPYGGNMQAGDMYNARSEYSPYGYGNRAQSGNESRYEFGDYGPEPFVVDIEEATIRNNAFRRALWTGNHLQLTLMSLRPGEDIGLEMHPHLDQFIRIEEGRGLVMMGGSPERLDLRRQVSGAFAFIIPAGTWHNLVNTGNMPLKLYSIYAPPQHPPGTVQMTKAEASEGHSGY